VPVLERFGSLYELRLMVDFAGANRGYCFATYTTRGDAKQAARELNDFQLRPRRYVGACLSVDNCRLFVGGIPRNKRRHVPHNSLIVVVYLLTYLLTSGDVAQWLGRRSLANGLTLTYA